MNYRMAYLSKDTDSSFFSFRTRTPTDILRILENDRALLTFEQCMGSPAFAVSARIGTEVKFSLRTRDPAVAEIRKNQATVVLARLWAARRSPPRQLAHKQIMALAGLVHDLWVTHFEQEPGDRAAWVAHKALNRAVQEGRMISVPAIVPGQIPDEMQLAIDAFGDNFTAGINALPVLPDHDQGLERRFGLLCDWVLTENTMRVDYATRKRLLTAIAIAGQTAPRRLKENADHFYGRDTHRERYPEFRSGRTLTQVFESWKEETQPSPSTVSNWRGHIRSLQEFIGHEDVSNLTKQDIVGWKDKLVRDGMAAKTINDGYLACLKRLLNYEIENHRLNENVAGKIGISTRGLAGTTPLPYVTDEVAQLLRLARGQTSAALRWLPWLAALSGSRIGEVAQLWGCKIKKVGEVWIMEIRGAEDGGRLKNSWSERDTPIHPAIIEEGFLDFVRERGQGPLFYHRSSGDRQKKHASKSVCNRVAAWIRLQEGFQNPRKAPNHAFRHWFKSELGALQVPDSLADSIVGHAKRSDADRYRHYPVDVKAPAVSRVRIPGVMVDAVAESTS
jgi:integrase